MSGQVMQEGEAPIQEQKKRDFPSYEHMDYKHEPLLQMKTRASNLPLALHIWVHCVWRGRKTRQHVLNCVYKST